MVRLGEAKSGYGMGVASSREANLGVEAVWSGLQARYPDEHAAHEKIIVHRDSPDATNHSDEGSWSSDRMPHASRASSGEAA